MTLGDDDTVALGVPVASTRRMLFLATSAIVPHVLPLLYRRGRHSLG